MTLSVLVPTREPASRVAALLAPLRDSADEVVVGVDHRIPVDELGGYQAIADRLVRFEHSGSDRGLAWLHAQCSGEWILLLAGDEVVSTELADALPSLCSRARHPPVLVSYALDMAGWIALARRAAVVA